MGGDNDKQSVGKLGESLVARYLEGRGWQIIGRNIREKFGEIDILAKAADGMLHFVEVKTISRGYAEYSGMSPEDNLSRKKLLKMKKIADWYANSRPELIGVAGWQIDLAAVRMDEEGSGGDEIKFYGNVS